MWWRTFFAFIIFFLAAKNIYAYIDPGTGSYLLQILLATLLAFLFTVKSYWKKIKGFLKRVFTRRKEDERK